MINLIRTPCLPKGNVTNCLIGDGHSNETTELKQLGVNCISITKSPLLEEEINNHADISAFNFGNGKVVVNKGSIGEEELKKFGIVTTFYNSEISSPYPKDIPLNVAFTGKHIICNSKYTATEILDFAKVNNIVVIHTKQGYSKCNLCIVSDNAVITEDEGLAYLLNIYQYNVLLISSGDVHLSDKHYGFLGGASCKISADKMYFSGDLSSHKDYERILEFLELHNVKPIFNNLRKLTDFGGIIQLTEEI